MVQDDGDVYYRDNMIMKYGKGYAMTETTLLVLDFSDGASSAERMAKKRKQVGPGLLTICTN